MALARGGPLRHPGGLRRGRLGMRELPLLAGRLATPVGEMVLVHRQERLCLAEFADRPARISRYLRHYWQTELPRLTPLPASIHRRFEAYFDGATTALQEQALLTRGSPFQEVVWAALRQTRPGQPISYAEMAARLGRPRAYRAVGAANGSNPISIAIPCHRLLGARGALTGYGGGLERKAWLLAHEARSPGQA